MGQDQSRVKEKKILAPCAGLNCAIVDAARMKPFTCPAGMSGSLLIIPTRRPTPVRGYTLSLLKVTFILSHIPLSRT